MEYKKINMLKYNNYPFTIVLFLFVSFQIMSQQKLPVQTVSGAVSLRNLQCTELKNALREEIFKNKHWKNLVENNKMAVGIVDLHDLNNIKFAGLNEDHMMYAASLPKIAILYAVMHAIDKGEIKETDAIKKDLKLMIAKSNNAAATRMMDLVGFEKIEAVLRLSSQQFYDENTGGGLWCGKRYAKTGKRNPDPMKGLSHGATTYQVCNFYYHLAIGELIDRENSTKMLEILKDPLLHHKFVNTLDRIAPDATIYRKSGSWKQFHADSALVWGPGRKYIIVALVENGSGESIIRNLVVPMEKVLEKAARMSCNN